VISQKSRKSKLEIRGEFRVSSFQFPVSSFEFPVSSFQFRFSSFGGDRRMKEQTPNSPFVILDMPPKEENLQVPGPYTRSPSLSPRANPAAEPVTLTINGTQVKVPPGTLVIEAAKQAGIEIPSYCYYPGLTLQGACRM
jgi:hypothetical protein